MENMIKEYTHTNFEENSIAADLQLDLYAPMPTINLIQLNGDNKKNIWDKSIKVEENGYYWNKKPEFIKGSNLHTTNKVIVEFFCGCGGTSLGFEMAGFEVILGVDIHQPSIKTFKTNHPNCSTILGDIKKINPKEVLDFLEGREIDVLIGGVPCQGFSLNNRKRHEGDERNLLYKEFVKFVKILKPKAVVLENVSGMRSAGNGEVVKNIERDLSEAGNMTVKSQMLFAPDYGVPQKRQRLIFVGIKDDVFNFGDIVKTHKPENYVTVKDAIGDLPSLQPKESSKKYKCEPFSDYQKFMRTGSQTITTHVAPNHPADTVEKIRSTIPGQPMYPKFKQRIRLAWDILSPTQVSGGIRPQFQFGHPEDSRGLTIRERCRLQSFPDTFIVSGGIVQGRVQTGNAVPPLLAKAVALALKKYL
jgi:DNA (cytosine-5)-methyltransferase 1